MKTKNEMKLEAPMGPGPTSPELRAALEVHTLAQMLYGQITVSHPWFAMGGLPSYGPMAMHEPFATPPWLAYQGWWR
jgi:hypothetical protein